MTDSLHPDDTQRLLDAIEVARTICTEDRAAIELEAQGITVDGRPAAGSETPLDAAELKDWTIDDAKAVTLVRTLSLAVSVLAEESPFGPHAAIDRTFDTLCEVVKDHA